MGDTEGRTDSREEGERDSAPQLSDQHFQCLFYPFLTLGFPYTSLCWRGTANSAATLLRWEGRKSWEMGGCLPYSGQGQTGVLHGDV